MHKSHDHALEVEAVEGVVLVSAEGGVALSLTPEAAADTGDLLMHAAALASGEQPVAASLKHNHDG